MRLTSRFLALLLLLLVALATFGNRVSPITIAGEPFEIEGPCHDGCYRRFDRCSGGCGMNAGCLQRLCSRAG